MPARDTAALGEAVRHLAGLYLTTTETAAMLRVSPRTLERMRVAGTGPKFLKVGPGKRSRVLYQRVSVEEWLFRFSFGSTAEYGR